MEMPTALSGGQVGQGLDRPKKGKGSNVGLKSTSRTDERPRVEGERTINRRSAKRRKQQKEDAVVRARAARRSPLRRKKTGRLEPKALGTEEKTQDPNKKGAWRKNDLGKGKEEIGSRNLIV